MFDRKLYERRLNFVKKRIFETIEKRLVESHGQSFMDIVDGLSRFSKHFKTTAPQAAQEFLDLKKTANKLLIKAEKEAEKNLQSDLAKFKGKTFTVPFLRSAKLVAIKSSGYGYYLEFEDEDGSKFNVSHRSNGNWDSRVEFPKGHPRYPGGYGPRGELKYPDFEGLMKVLVKSR